MHPQCAGPSIIEKGRLLIFSCHGILSLNHLHTWHSSTCYSELVARSCVFQHASLPSDHDPPGCVDWARFHQDFDLFGEDGEMSSTFSEHPVNQVPTAPPAFDRADAGSVCGRSRDSSKWRCYQCGSNQCSWNSSLQNWIFWFVRVRIFMTLRNLDNMRLLKDAGFTFRRWVQRNNSNNNNNNNNNHGRHRSLHLGTAGFLGQSGVTVKATQLILW